MLYLTSVVKFRTLTVSKLLHILNLAASNVGMNGKKTNLKNLEINGSGPIVVLSRHLARKTEESHEKSSE
jgi:hypothetical protein